MSNTRATMTEKQRAIGYEVIKDAFRDWHDLPERDRAWFRVELNRLEENDLLDHWLQWAKRVISVWGFLQNFGDCPPGSIKIFYGNMLDMPVGWSFYDVDKDYTGPTPLLKIRKQ